MGAKGSKTKLTSKDIKMLQTKTGLSEAEITGIHSQFMANNPDGKLDRNEFKNLYLQFRSEPYQDLNAITELAFQEFDKDRSGTIGFDEFLVNL
jgi:Ca2+-binding EF-hand superfamily protein